MPTYSYETEVDTTVELTLATPAQAPTGPSFTDPGEPGYPAEWDVDTVTFLGVPCDLSAARIAELLWPAHSDHRSKFIAEYFALCERAVTAAEENYEPDYDDDYSSSDRD